MGCLKSNETFAHIIMQRISESFILILISSLVTCSFMKSNHFKFINLFKRQKIQKIKEHIRQCFPHYFKLGHNSSKAKRKILPSYIGKDAVSTSRCFESFRSGDFSLEEIYSLVIM